MQEVRTSLRLLNSEGYNYSTNYWIIYSSLRLHLISLISTCILLKLRIVILYTSLDYSFVLKNTQCVARHVKNLVKEELKSLHWIEILIVSDVSATTVAFFSKG